jgi:sugar lactone lactonase YvrE
MLRIICFLAALAPVAAGCDCGSGDDDDGDGGVCPVLAGQFGDVRVTVDAPAGAPVAVVLQGSDGHDQPVEGPGAVEMPAGPVTVTTSRTRGPGTIVGTVYVATVDVAELCVEVGGEAPLHVTVAADPASHRLWVADATGGQIVGIGGDDLGESGAPTPGAVLTGSFTSPGHMAFGPDGNLWVLDDSHVEVYANQDLATGGAVTPAIVLSGPSIADGSVPGVADLAFDRDDSLWLVHQAGNRVMRFDAGDIAATGEPTPGLTVSGESLAGPQAMALDQQGNLWVSGDSMAIVEYEAARLGTDVTGPADVEVHGQTPEPVVVPLGGAAALAFDGAGNLWAAHFGANVVARYTQRELEDAADPEAEEPGVVTPVVQVHVPVDILLDDIAIDEEDGLWLTGAAGRVDRLSPDQLRRAGDATPQTLLTPAGLVYAAGLALYPGPSGTAIPY